MWNTQEIYTWFLQSLVGSVQWIQGSTWDRCKCARHKSGFRNGSSCRDQPQAARFVQCAGKSVQIGRPYSPKWRLCRYGQMPQDSARESICKINPRSMRMGCRKEAGQRIPTMVLDEAIPPRPQKSDHCRSKKTAVYPLHPAGQRCPLFAASIGY